jgi:hypothetical protein
VGSRHAWDQSGLSPFVELFGELAPQPTAAEPNPA